MEGSVVFQGVPGESIAVDNGKVMIIAWKDTRVVQELSTKHDGTLSFITRRKKAMVKLRPS